MTLSTPLSILTALAVMLTACSGTSSQKNAAQETPVQQTPAVIFSSDSAMMFLEMQTAVGPRVPGSAAHKETARNLIEKLSSFAPDTIITQTPVLTQPGSGNQVQIHNILGRWGTDKPVTLLLLAHWDTRPVADQDPDSANHVKPIDGANDGASGVAVLLEVARHLSSRLPEDMGVDILFTDLEDSGTAADDQSWCLGTQYFAKNLPYQPGRLPRYAILLDMVGGKKAQFHREYFSDQFAPDIVEYVWDTARKAGFGSTFVNQPGSPINDDHIPLNQAGIPTIDIIENKNPGTGTFNPTWHTMEDNINNIDPATLNAVGQTILNIIYK